MSKVMIYGEIKAGKLKKTALELASEGRKLADSLGGDVTAVLIGPQAETFAPDLARCGADTVCVVEAPELESLQLRVLCAGIGPRDRRKEA